VRDKEMWFARSALVVLVIAVVSTGSVGARHVRRQVRKWPVGTFYPFVDYQGAPNERSGEFSG